MRIILSILTAILLVSCAAPPARSQDTATVVAVCGTLPLAYLPGAVRSLTQDVNGTLCTPSGSGGGSATAANQTLQITQETALNTILGLQTDAACSTDNGTCTIAALAKRTNQRLTTINTTLGTPFQAAGSIGNSAFGVNAQATGGASTTGNIAANNTTAVVVKGSAGTLYGVQLYGLGSAPAYLKIYNATSATCGSGTPVKRLMIPAASTAANGAGSNVAFGAAGVAFGTGITYCVTTSIADNDTTAPAASTFLINIDWL